ncbi:MAG: hypothetical protein IJ545_04895 [Alphaproteobacteria bacterium]|nr:hypothetical protein [Alphaproteobacteria bacterium]
MSKTLKLVLTDHWFEEIKSGRKTHEYRKVTPFWIKRFEKAFGFMMNYKEDIVAHIENPPFMPLIEFQKAYRKNAEKMLFQSKSLSIYTGTNTDLKCDWLVYDIELGERVK